LHAILSPISLVRTREVPSKTIFASKQTRDKQDGSILILQRNLHEIFDIIFDYTSLSFFLYKKHDSSFAISSLNQLRDYSPQ
jgi:hypothetical protein